MINITRKVGKKFLYYDALLVKNLSKNAPNAKPIIKPMMVPVIFSEIKSPVIAPKKSPNIKYRLLAESCLRVPMVKKLMNL